LGETTEAKAMAKYLAKKGIAKKFIFLEEDSMDTIGNIFFTRKKYLEKKKWKKPNFVSSKFHIDRIKLLAEWILDSSYKPQFVASSNKGVSPIVLIKRRFIEERLITYSKKYMFPEIEKGNMRSIEKFLFSKHPAYSNVKNEEWNKIMGKIRRIKKLY